MECADTSYLFDDLGKTLMQSQGYVARLAKLNAQDADLQGAANFIEKAIRCIIASSQKKTDGIPTWIIA